MNIHCIPQFWISQVATIYFIDQGLEPARTEQRDECA